MQEQVADRNGFVLPIIVFGLVLMSVVAVGALLTAGDEVTSSRAMRESSTAFYAAEAGLQAVVATWDSIKPQVDLLGPGDSVVLDWQPLAGGSEYRPTVHRWDNGGPRIFLLSIEGRALPDARRTLNYVVMWYGGEGYKLGQCCDAALTVKGGVKLDGDQVVSGFDEHPPGWESADVCSDSLYDKPGIAMVDTTLLELVDSIGTPSIEGVPPLVQDAAVTDSAFDWFGQLSWEELRDKADIVIDGSVDEVLLSDTIVYPRYNMDGSCDTSHPYNWGSNDPADPCFDHFPIILIKGEVEIEEAYGQGLVIIDWDDSQPVGEKGGEFELEDDMVFNGIILGKGCVEIQKGAQMHGAVYVDADYRNEDSCGGDWDYEMNEDPSDVIWSQCAVDRAIVRSGLDTYATIEFGGTVKPLSLRAFEEPLR